MSDPPPRLLVYTRQSLARLGETRDTSLSLQAQKQVIEDWAASNGFVVVRAIDDHDLKGDDPTRPGLIELEASAQPGDTVAVYKFDRLARDVVLQESLVRRLQAKNVQVISVTEPSTRLTRVIYGAVNEEFRDALAQRIRDASKQQALRGHYLGANTPYGYVRAQVRAIPLPDGGEYLRPTGVLMVDETEAAIVRELFERVAAGEALHAIVVDFNARGIPTRHRRAWLVTTLKHMIRNRWYYGVATYKGQEVAPGLHAPIVDRDLWERANLLLARPTRRHTRHTATSWLEGYVSHACGQRMYLICIQQTSTRTRYSEHFYCRGVYQTPKCRHPRRQISRPKLDAAVRQCMAVDLAGILPIADALQRAIVTAGGPETVQRRATLDAKRARVLARYERVRDAWAAGMESLDWLADEQAKRDAALAEVDAELAGLPATPDPAEYARVGAQLQSVAGVLPELDDGALTALLAELGTVLVDGDGVRMVYGPAVAPFVPSPFVADVG